MRETQVTIPELGLIAGTRVALGVGVGLLLAGRLPNARRRAIGWTLLAFGALSTIPLALEVFGHRRPSVPAEEPQQMMRDLQAEDVDVVEELSFLIQT